MKEEHFTDKFWKQPPCKICKWALGHSDRCPEYFKDLLRIGCITKAELKVKLSDITTLKTSCKNVSRRNK